MSKLLDLGNRYLEACEYDQAIAAYNGALTIDPNCVEAYIGEADAYVALGEYKQVIASYEEVLDIDPDYVEAYIGEADAYVALEDYENAITVLEKGYEETGEEKLKDQFLELSEESANQLLDKNELDAALRRYLSILDYDPMNVESYLGVTEVYLRQGDFEKALEYAEAGYEKTGDERLKEKIDMIKSGNISDSKGNLLKESFYDGNGNLLRYQTFTYNDEGKMATVTSYDPGGNEVSGLELTYDEDGRVINGYSNWVDEETLLRTVHEYDEMGREITETQYDEEDFSKIKYVERYSYNGNQEQSYRVDTTYYGDNGELIPAGYRLQEFNGDGLITKCEYYTDFWGNGEYGVSLISLISYNADGKTDRQEDIHYDSNGKEVDRETIEFMYDEHGNYTGSRKYGADGSVLYETRRN